MSYTQSKIVHALLVLISLNKALFTSWQMELISAPEILSGLATSVHQLRTTEQHGNANIQAKQQVFSCV